MIKINNYKLTPAITATWGDITGDVSDQKDLVEYIKENGTAAWGSISGNISDQKDLMNTLGSYATQSWVSSKQFATESWVSNKGYITSSALTGYATEQWVSSNFLSSTALTGYATQSWVSEQGYLTEHQSLDGYATQSWVSSQGYLYSKNSSGDKIMNFNTTTPEIFLKNTVSQQLNINPWLISMHGSSYGTLISPGTVGIQMGDIYSYKVAGAICDSDMSSAVLIVRDADDYLKIDCHNIYTYSGGISITYPFSELASKGDLSGYATQSWVSSKQFATQSWVTSQGYALNSDLKSLATRVSTLEVNYGDAITITNNILG